MEFYERVSGARMHAIYIRPGGVYKWFNKFMIYDILYFMLQFTAKINRIEEMLTSNRI
jgi:NADH:ubiquinone oxidoreductase subunit D